MAKKSNGFDFIGSTFGTDLSIKPQSGGKPKPGETSGPQNVSGPAGWGASIPANLYQNAGGGPLAAQYGGVLPGSVPGLTLDIGGTFWGVGATGTFTQPRKGSYATYRMMGLDPTFRLIRTLIWSPILSSTWTVQAAEGIEVDETGKKFTFDPTSGRVTKVPQSAIDFIKDQIIPLRMSLLRECLRYLEFGWRPFERVYELGNGGPNGGRMFTLPKVKPLLPEFAQILHDGHGNFGGLTCGGLNSGMVPTGEGRLPPNKSWIVTNDGEAGNLYGLSRYEPGFDAWCDTQVIRRDQYLLRGKLSGVMPTLYYRPGNTKIDGQDVDNFQVAKQIIAVVMAGGGMLVPTTEYSDTDLQANPELAAIAPWKLVIEDAGSYAPAMAGMIADQEYRDKLKVRAWGWPERAVLEAQASGSRADSESHTASAMQDIENIDDDIAAQVSQGSPLYDVPGLVDELLRLNWGDGTQGAIILKPAPLVDDKLETYQALISAVFASPAIAPFLVQVPDWYDIFQHMDVKCVDDVKEKLPALLAACQAAAVAKAQPKPPGQGGQQDQSTNNPGAQGKPKPAQVGGRMAATDPSATLNGNGTAKNGKASKN